MREESISGERQNPASTSIEVALPLPLNHGWITHACRAAALARPRWSPDARVWTTHAPGVPGAIRISSVEGRRAVRVVAVAGPEAEDPSLEHAATVRKIATALITGMQWAVAKRAGRDRAL